MTVWIYWLTSHLDQSWMTTCLSPLRRVVSVYSQWWRQWFYMTSSLYYRKSFLLLYCNKADLATGCNKERVIVLPSYYEFICHCVYQLSWEPVCYEVPVRIIIETKTEWVLKILYFLSISCVKYSHYCWCLLKKDYYWYPLLVPIR